MAAFLLALPTWHNLSRKSYFFFYKLIKQVKNNVFKKRKAKRSCGRGFWGVCMLFYDYFHHEKFPNIPVSLVSELHNYSTRSASSNQVAIPLFRTNLRRFCPSIIGSFFWNDIPQSIRDKPSKKMFKKALLRWYLAQY